PVPAGDDVAAPVDPVAEIDVQMTGGAEHHLGPRGAPAIRVAGRVVLLVRLALHYPADQQLAVLEPPNQEPPQEFGPHLGRGALVERSPERAKGPGQARPFRRNFRSLVSGHVLM